MKGLLKFIGTLGLLYGVSSGMAARAQETGAREDTAQVRTIPLWGHVKDGFTYAALHGTFVTLMREDSTVVDTMHVQCFNSGTPQEDTYYKFDVPAGGRVTSSKPSIPITIRNTWIARCVTWHAIPTSMPGIMRCAVVRMRRLQTAV